MEAEELKKYKCVLCGNIDFIEIVDGDGNRTQRVFNYKDRNTKEQLCKSCARINEQIWRQKTG